MQIGILLAAGASRRFGAANKLLAPMRGEALIRHAAKAMLAVPDLAQRIAITSDPAVFAALPAGFSHHPIASDQPMSASFRAGIAYAKAVNARALVLCLGDMPGISPESLSQLIAQPGTSACQSHGVRLPPIKLMAEDFDRAAALSDGDRGARLFLQRLAPEALIALPAAEAMDIDTLADLHAFDRGL